VDDLVELVSAVDGILREQAYADGTYFFELCLRPLSAEERLAVRQTILRAYRRQYILSGAEDERFLAILRELTTAQQIQRIGEAVAAVAEGAKAV
jgi:hypothetical protein